MLLAEEHPNASPRGSGVVVDISVTNGVVEIDLVTRWRRVRVTVRWGRLSADDRSLLRYGRERVKRPRIVRRIVPLSLPSDSEGFLKFGRGRTKGTAGR